ncbi:unnamed protein product, partial [Pocillopora meandrina]
MDLVGEFYGLTLDTLRMILPLFLSTLLTVSGNLEELRGSEELIAELRMDMLQGCKGEMVKMIERGISMVEDMRSCGLYHDNDCIEECLKFCFMPILRDELHGAARLWNLHRILPSTNSKSPSGRPDVLFFLPE